MVGYALPEGEREKFPQAASAHDGYPEMTVEEILSDPTIEAVAVETEEVYLTKYARMVAEAGKHLHMEKPGGTALADFEALIACLKQKGLVFSTGYMYRFNPMLNEVIDRVKGGELGKIYSVEAHMDCCHPKEVREWLSAFPDGMMFFLGCHLIDIIYRIQGEPSEVLPLSASTGIDGVRSKDLGMAVFKYPNGVSFAKTSAAEYGGFMRRQLVICGERGTIEVRPLEAYTAGGLYTEMKECHEASWAAEGEPRRSKVYDRYDSMMRNFAEMIRGKENPYSYDYELALYKLVLRACGKEG